MNESETKPAVLIVCGAWHTATHYQPFARALESRGFEVRYPCLPTCDSATTSPELDMLSDARLVDEELRQLIEVQGKDVLLAPHSYGGVPCLQAVQQSMSKHNRQQAGKPGGIVGMVSICAFIIPTDTSLEDLNGGKPAPFIVVDADGMTTTGNPAHLFFHDLPPAERDLYVSALVQQPAKAHASKITTDPVAYRFLNTAVVVCQDDQATPLFVQELMLNNMKKDGAKVTQEYRMSTSHSPQLSKPEELADHLEHFLGTLSVK